MLWFVFSAMVVSYMGLLGWYTSWVLLILGNCWIYTAGEDCSRRYVTRRHAPVLSLQWSVALLHAHWCYFVYVNKYTLIDFCLFVLGFLLEGLVSLILLVALLWIVAKMDLISLTVSVSSLC